MKLICQLVFNMTIFSVRSQKNDVCLQMGGFGCRKGVHNLFVENDDDDVKNRNPYGIPFIPYNRIL